MITLLLWQGRLTGGALGSPHDSTTGAGPGFYVFSIVVLLVIVVGVGIVWLKERGPHERHKAKPQKAPLTSKEKATMHKSLAKRIEFRR